MLLSMCDPKSMQVNPSSLNNECVFDKSFQVHNGNLPSTLSLPRVLM